MIENPRPTRAEASDVEYAVLSGTDATMLSGESANGDYPAEAVATMAKLDVKAENHYDEYGDARPAFNNGDVTEAFGKQVAEMVKDLDIKTIVTTTSTGYSARMISKYHPNADILALTFDDRVRRGLMVNWGVQPIVVDKPENSDGMFDFAAKKAVETGLAKEGDLILVVAGLPVGEKGTTNVMSVKLIGSELAQGQGVGDKTVIGKAFLASNAADANSKAVDGGVLVAKNTNKDFLPAIKKASAIIVEDGGMTSHAAVLGISLGIPVIVSAKGATENISDGQTITVDARRGIVYAGAANSL